jgi:hypothetical protein
MDANSPETGWLGKVAGFAVALIFAGSLLEAVETKLISVDTWWFFFTTVFAFLIGEGFTILYNRATGSLNSDFTVPLEFVAFCLVILVGGVASGWATGQIANAFNTVSVVAYIAFFAINVFPALGLYFDFLRLRRQRLARPNENETPF